MTLPNEHRSRITVVETVTYQERDSQPRNLSPNRGYLRWLQSHEEPYSRRLTLTEEWSSIETGWVGDAVGILYLHNEYPQQTDASTGPIIEIGIFVPPPKSLPDLWDGTIVAVDQLLPGETYRVHPIDTKNRRLRLRPSADGSIRSVRCPMSIVPE